MAIVTKTDAARLAKIGKKRLLEDIKAGRVSVTKDNAGREGIDPAELMRVYGELHADPLATKPAPAESPSQQPPDQSAVIAAQQAQINLLTDQLRKSEARADQFYSDLQQAQARLLAAPEKKGFFARIFGD